MSLRDRALPMRGRSPFLSASRLVWGWACFGLLVAGGGPSVVSAQTNISQGKPATQSSTLTGYPSGREVAYGIGGCRHDQRQ
jgi:hypothetical protein